MFVTKKVTPRIQKILSFSLFPDTFGPSRAPQVRGKAWCVTVFTRRSLAGQGLVFMMMIKIIFIMIMAMMR